MNAAHDPFADAEPYDRHGTAAPEPLSIPEANQRRWSGKKTAVAAALAVGLSTTVAVGAASALPLGSQAGGGESGGGHAPGFRGSTGGWRTEDRGSWGTPPQGGAAFQGQVPAKPGANPMPRSAS